MTGIDLIINNINDYLADNIWLNNTIVYHNRVFENVKDKGLVPEILSDNNYIEVLHDSKEDGKLFWRVMPDNKRTDEKLKASLFIYLNLKKVYPNEVLWEAREIAVKDILGSLIYTQFNYENTVIGKDSFSMWNGSSQNLHDMNDFFMFRIDGYIYLSCVGEIIAPTSVTITLQAETGGTTDPEPGVYNVAYKSNNAFLAIVNTGYRFAGWLMGTITTMAKNLPYIATADATLKAQFIKVWTLTSSVVGNGTIDAVDGTYDEGATTTVTATPASGSVFSKFTRNTVDSFVNPIVLTFNEAIDLVATFVLSAVNLIVTKTGNGTITPSEGIYPTEPGTDVEFTAVESDSNFYFKHWGIDGDLVTTNPYTLEVLTETSVNAVFEAWINIMNVFSTAPQSIGGKWYFRNLQETLNKYNQYIVCFGNSLTAQNYPNYLRNYLVTKLNLPYRYTLYQEGLAGRTGAQMLIDFNTDVLPLINVGGDNLVIINEVVNDMANSYTYTEAAQHLIDIAQLCTDNGAKSMILTATPTTTAIPNYIQNANALILANTVSDYVFDLSTIPETLDPSNLTYYVDGVHWTNTLALIIANAIGVYIDSVNYPKHVQVKASQVATFNDTKLNVGRFHADYPSFEIICKIPNYTTTAGYIYSKRLSAGADVEIQMSYGSSGVINCYITTATGTLITATLNNKIISDKWTRIKFDTVGNNLHLSVFNIEQQQDYYEHIVPFTGVVKNVAADNVLGIRDYDNTTPMVNIQVAYVNINNGAFECFFNHKNGLNCYDKLGTLTGLFSRTTTQLWSNTTEFVEPYFATKGTTIYTANSNPTDIALWKFISGSETSQIIAYYTKLGYFAAGLGVLKGLLNTYTIPTDAEIPAGDYTFAELDALTQTDELRIIKTANNISNLLVRKKQ